MKSQVKPDERPTTDGKLFSELYERNLSKVLRFIYYRVGDKSIAEDLTGAVFEKALTKFKRFSADKASFSTWVIAIARNTVIDHARKAGRNRAVAANPGTHPSSEEQVIEDEKIKRLFRYLARLSDSEQEIISLKFGSTLTNREIAKVKRVSESNVGTILYRAVKKLRVCFEEEDNER